MAPSTTKAIVIKSKGNAAIETVNMPKLRDGYLLVKTTAVGLNPTDWKHIDFVFGGNPTGARVGCDYAGVVEEVGSKVAKSFKKGDRVAGVAHGSNQSVHEDGTFAEYIVVKADVAIKIPDNVTDEEGATLGIGVTTVGQGLYQTLKLPLPDKPASTAFPVLIYGGSSATGILGIQFAKVSGVTVVTTASPRNFDYLESLGADHCFDYKSPTCAEDIKKATGGRLQHTWDCISDPESAKLCIAAMSEEGGRYACLLPVPDEIIQEANPKVQKSMTWAYTVFGEEFEKSEKVPVIKEDLEFGKMFWELARHLLAEGKVKAARQRVNQGGKGLEGVMVGLKELKEGKHSGEKYVYTF